MTEEKSDAPAISQAMPTPVAAPVAVPVDLPIFLSQAPPMVASDAKPVVDKPSKITAPTLFEKK